MQVSKAKKGYKLVDAGFGKDMEIPEEWEIKKLEEISEIVGGGTPDSNNEEFWNGDVLWAVPSDITKLSSKFIENTKRKISQRGLEKSSAKLLPVGTILITSRATIGECAIAKKPISTNQGFQNLICNENNFNQFWYYAIQFHKNKLLKLCNATTFLEISKNNMKKILIESPKLKIEQQKISSILSNVDDTLEKTNQLIQKIQTIKNGLIQKLFTKGIGHTKFKKIDGIFGQRIKIPDSWDMKNIFDVCDDIFLGLTSKVDFVESDGIPLVRANNISTGKLSFDKIKYISRTQHEFLTRYHKSKLGDVLMTKSGSLGTCALVDVNDEFSIYESIINLQPKSGILDSKFLLNLLRDNRVQNILKKNVVGATVGHINLTDFKKLFIPLPSIKEQKQIRTIISNVDSQINKEKLQKSNLELLKKGLMQKLLTGQIRVKV